MTPWISSWRYALWMRGNFGKSRSLWKHHDRAFPIKALEFPKKYCFFHF